MDLLEIEIRSAIPSDGETVTALLMAQFREHSIEMPADAVRSAVEGLLADQFRGFILIAVQAAAAVGVACVSFTWTLEHGGKSAWLDELFVVPEERNRGIGKDMLTAVLHKARAAGCAAVDLEVDSSHARGSAPVRATRLRSASARAVGANFPIQSIGPGHS